MRSPRLPLLALALLLASCASGDRRVGDFEVRSTGSPWFNAMTESVTGLPAKLGLECLDGEGLAWFSLEYPLFDEIGPVRVRFLPAATGESPLDEPGAWRVDGEGRHSGFYLFHDPAWFLERAGRAERVEVVMNAGEERESVTAFSVSGLPRVVEMATCPFGG